MLLQPHCKIKKNSTVRKILIWAGNYDWHFIKAQQNLSPLQKKNTSGSRAKKMNL